ncbi:MAG: PD40 domain-containing protein [Vicingus serpentipes]|nr:PD40 domain-containing protein [Vicingus serpentipes]
MKKNVLLLVILSLVFNFSVSSQDTDGGKKTGAIGYKFKMQEARHAFLGERNVRVALNKYRELLKDFTNDGMVNFRIGECYYALKQYDLSVEYYQNARRINENVVPEMHFNLGLAYHKADQLEKALASFEKFKSTAKKKYLKLHDVDKMIAQVHYALKMKETPVNVKVVNMGENINSRGGDYSPSISADGKTMIFTSRRADTKGGEVDKEGDFKYFEDIYISDWDSVNNTWGKAYPIPGKLNTEGHDASLSISPDGQKIYIYRNDGVAYIGDIFESKKRKSSGTWGAPKPLDKPINSSYFESSACLSADGNKMYFVSERIGEKNGAQGNGDIYVVEKISKNAWGEPKNLGPTINTPYDEISVFIHSDGKTLFFSSKGHLSMGGHDIFMSKLQEDSTWSKPENLGYPINSVDDDVHFTLSVDGKTAYYSAVKNEGFGERDIYKIDMSNYPVLSEGVNTNLTILKGTISSGEEKVIADIVFKNENGKDVAKTSSNDDGDYFITLTGGQKYSLVVSAEGYQSTTKEITLPLGEGKTLTHEENFVLNRQ